MRSSYDEPCSSLGAWEKSLRNITTKAIVFYVFRCYGLRKECRNEECFCPKSKIWPGSVGPNSHQTQVLRNTVRFGDRSAGRADHNCNFHGWGAAVITTLLVPGLDGSTGGHWQQWWLENDPELAMVSFTDLGDPVPGAMEVELIEAILTHPGALLVGHSLGAILIARVLAEWPDLDVAGALLVAPAAPRDHKRIYRFDPISEVSLPVPATAVISQNDPVMEHSRARALAKAWKAGVVDLGMAGHINLAAGFGPWPFGLQLRDALLGRSIERPPGTAKGAGFRAGE